MTEAPIDIPRAHFHDNRARRYDDTIRRVIPAYDSLHLMSGLLLKELLPADARLLVVGCGTGTEMAAFLADNPGWTAVGCDPSEAMLAVAAERLDEAGVGARAELHPCTVECLPAEATFDAATILLVMHFLPDDGAKQSLLTATAGRLKAAAPLILADMHGDPETEHHRRLLAAWAGWQARHGIPPEEIEKGLAHVHRDIHRVPLERMIALLESAGFTDIEHFFHALIFGGWTARRAAGEGA
ncbi:class I SAM-dependent methyltransferase [Roseospirillum parvum]|uniref:tRNA (Cmo5U34)-methyltransferase n=1 Tax=Roseospirillum parvum TaxID=83401 RepID=A0A1G8B6T5_9PROT|nr:class I SAM-dependent methyltransferase [Roseospirillum parvum]SDH28952.1 tRNA (cmo5U34)-methyltransferase [Roseospirillum parvum]